MKSLLRESVNFFYVQNFKSRLNNLDKNNRPILIQTKINYGGNIEEV